MRLESAANPTMSAPLTLALRAAKPASKMEQSAPVYEPCESDEQMHVASALLHTPWFEHELGHTAYEQSAPVNGASHTHTGKRSAALALDTELSDTLTDADSDDTDPAVTQTPRFVQFCGHISSEQSAPPNP